MNKIRITLDNKEVIEIYGNIPSDRIKIIGDDIFYDIEISKSDYINLISKGIKVCKHYTTCCPNLFNGGLGDDEVQLIKDQYSIFYLHRRNRININQKEEFYSFLKKIVSNQDSINLMNEVQKDINEQLVIDKLEIFNNNTLLRTERYENGFIISNDGVKSLIQDYRDKKLRDLGI
jgi:hypothetical protein